MSMERLKAMGLGKKLSQFGALFSLITLVVYGIYGIVYDYFDVMVFLAVASGVVCAQVYVMMDGTWCNFLNLVSVFSLSYALGLFFLNSYPVWADRLNNITMYGSRGTLVPVIAIIVLLLACILIETVSCFIADGKEERK